MSAYYNEHDPLAAQWLRNLIGAGLIPEGDVDERSIVDVRPGDVAGYVQQHYFSGIGGWPFALRLAGWPDDRPVVTGSAPCQPFSQAGKGAGIHDPRHLWPDFFRLLRAQRPPVVMGEQVAGAAGYGWFDGVSADLEGEGYTCRAVDIPACAVDADQIRQRLYWVAVASPTDAGKGWRELRGPGESSGSIGERPSSELTGSHGCSQLADTSGEGLSPSEREALPGAGRRQEGRATEQCDGALDHPNPVGRLGELRRRNCDADDRIGALADRDLSLIRRQPPTRQFAVDEQDSRTGPGYGDHTLEHGQGERWGEGWTEYEFRRWRDTLAGADRREWLICHDGKARRTQPGLPLLVNAVSGRVAVPLPGEETRWVNRIGAWKGFGNAIVPTLAAEVIRALMETHPQRSPS